MPTRRSPAYSTRAVITGCCCRGPAPVNGVTGAPGKGPLAIPGGVGGASLATTYQVKVAKVGKATLARIPARTGLIGPELGGGNVFLGDVVLRRYRVTFDFKRDTLWLEK